MNSDSASPKQGIEAEELRFLEFLSRSAAPRPALACFAPHYHFFSLHQVRAFSQIFRVLPAHDRDALALVARVLHEEMGAGVASEAHSRLFERFANTVGFDRPLPVPEQQVCAGVIRYLRELESAFGATLGRALGAYVFLEESAVATYPRFLDAIRAAGIDDDHAQFFVVHAELELHHARAARGLADRLLPSLGSEREAFDLERAALAEAWGGMWRDLRKIAFDESRPT